MYIEMKKLFVITLGLFLYLCVGMNTHTLAQNRRPGPPSAGQRAEQAEKMIEELGLTEEQGEKFKAIEEEFFVAAQEVRQETDDRESRKAQIKPLRKKRNQELKSLLSEEQFEKYKEMTKRDPGKRRPDGKRKSPEK